MKSEQEIFVILMEECSEVSHVASKCVRFGPFNTFNMVSTASRLENELGDLFAVVDILHMMDIVSYTKIEEASQRKLKKLKEWSNLMEVLNKYD